jgi:hypothetical protein
MLPRRVERHLRRFGVPPARFGTEAVHAPRFVFDLRNGREPRPPTVARVEAYIARIEAEASACSDEEKDAAMFIGERTRPVSP